MPATRPHAWLKYFILAVLAWVIVDFTTTAAIGNPVAYYSIFMPALLLFYVGYPLTFSALIYKLRLSTKGLFLAMIAGIVVVVSSRTICSCSRCPSACSRYPLPWRITGW